MRSTRTKARGQNEYSQLKATLSESEYEAARSSTLTAFYTPATVIHPIYRALERFGVKGGKILEPSMGTGAFLAHTDILAAVMPNSTA